MARVAMLRLVSEIRFSRSTLHDVTASGWIMEIWEWDTDGNGNGIMRLPGKVGECTYIPGLVFWRQRNEQLAWQKSKTSAELKARTKIKWSTVKVFCGQLLYRRLQAVALWQWHSSSWPWPGLLRIPPSGHTEQHRTVSQPDKGIAQHIQGLHTIFFASIYKKLCSATKIVVCVNFKTLSLVKKYTSLLWRRQVSRKS